MTWQLHEADCIEAMQQMEDSSVDAIVTDPPYGLEFMGKEWDSLSSTPLVKRSGREEATSGAGMTEANGIYPKARNRSGVKFGGNWTYECSVCERRDMMRKGCRCDVPSWTRVLVNGNAPARVMQEWHERWAIEALRVLKPGGHLLAFGGTRTYHRLACAIEDAGFEIRDCLAWMYGSGFPKSLDVSKAIDKAAGAEREVVGSGKRSQNRSTGLEDRPWMEDARASVGGQGMAAFDVTAPATAAAEQWQGWGTALKPAFEPIVLARKPLVGTVAANVLEHGTGALNIDGTRIGLGADEDAAKLTARSGGSGEKFPNGIYQDGMANDGDGWKIADQGRWPANVVLDEAAAALLDEQTGESASRIGKPRAGRNGEGWGLTATGAEYDDFGGASRFFYVAKSASAERNRGLEHHADRTRATHGAQGQGPLPQQTPQVRDIAAKNSHPTVKPVELMQWLCRLVTPPNGTILDPFTGSGSTGIAALREGFSFIGIEREAEYVEIARDRIIGDAPMFNVATEVNR